MEMVYVFALAKYERWKILMIKFSKLSKSLKIRALKIFHIVNHLIIIMKCAHVYLPFQYEDDHTQEYHKSVIHLQETMECLKGDKVTIATFMFWILYCTISLCHLQTNA